MSRRRIIILTIVGYLAVILIAFLVISVAAFMYTPKELGPSGITFWFICVLVGSGALFGFIEYSWKMRKEVNRETPKKFFLSSIRTGFLLGFSVTVLLALSSLKSLSIRDVILFTLTVIIIELYFRTRKSSRK